MPKILDETVQKLKQRGVKAASAYPIAVSTLQKSGSLKQGSLKATAKGVKRAAMTQKQRQAAR